MKYEQLELFEVTEIERLRQEISKLKKELDNVRRGVFSRHTEHANLIVQMREQIDNLMSFKDNKI